MKRRLDAGDVVALVAYGAVFAAVWRLSDWATAVVCMGLPVLVGYVVVETLRVRRGGRE